VILVNFPTTGPSSQALSETVTGLVGDGDKRRRQATKTSVGDKHRASVTGIVAEIVAEIVTIATWVRG
jgi:hypothetical protein